MNELVFSLFGLLLHNQESKFIPLTLITHHLNDTDNSHMSTTSRQSASSTGHRHSISLTCLLLVEPILLTTEQK